MQPSVGSNQLGLTSNMACSLGSIALLDRIWDSSEAFVDKTSRKTPDKTFTLRKFIRTDKFYRQYQFSLSMEEAVKQKSLEMVKWLSTRFQGCTVPGEVGKITARAGLRDILAFLLENDVSSLGDAVQGANVGHKVEWSDDLVEVVILNRRSDVAWWLLKKAPSVEQNLSYALGAAVEVGDIAMAEWLLKQDVEWWDADAFDQSIEHNLAGKGQLEVLQWLNEQRQIEGRAGLVTAAAKGGHLHVVCWLLERDQRKRKNANRLTRLGGEASLAIHAAAVKGHLEVAKFLHSVAKRPTNAVQQFQQTENQNHLIDSVHVLQRDKPVSGDTMAEACRNGHLEVVKWLYMEYGDDPEVDIFYGYDSTSTAMYLAACNNHLHVLQYLHRLQVSLAGSARKRRRDRVKMVSRPTFSNQAMEGAAANGHLAVVEWFFTHQTKVFPPGTMDRAASNGHLHIVQWLHGHHVECTQAAMDGAATNGHLAVVQWLHSNTTAGCTTKAMDGAAGNGHLDVVKWLHSNRAEGCTTAAMDAAAEGHFQVVKWLHEHSTSGCTEKALTGADFETFLFLHLHCKVQLPEETQRAREICHTIRQWIVDRYPAFAL